MKTRLHLILALILFTTQLSTGQKPHFNEKTGLLTDKSLYITGETIQFSSFLISQDSDNTLSNYIYLELITPDGKQIVGEKYKLINQEYSGSVIIPNNVLSGNYYLRAYTRYMRNFGPENYEYRFLKIVNPDKSDILNGYHQDTAIMKDLNNITVAKHLEITLNKEEFKNREKVSIICKNNYKSDSIKKIVISVTQKEGVIYKELKHSSMLEEKLYYHPEITGISISGVVLDKKSGKALPSIKINLSIMNQNNNQFYPQITDSVGHFSFVLPEFYHSNDIFISCDNEENIEPEILVDNDFCTETVILPSPPFYLTELEEKVAYSYAVNNNVRNYFNIDTIGLTEIEKSQRIDTIPFYGKANSIIHINDFIELPVIEDYFTELPFPVKVRGTKGEKKLTVSGNQTEMFIYEPLVMIDFIPIYDHADILSISPKKVSRIDVVTEPYIRGEVTYGGIINLISVENDFASIKLPPTGLFLNYTFLSKKLNANYDRQSVEENIPDTRNTLYWNPDFDLSDGKSIDFSFYTGDTDGEYQINVIGISQDGKIILNTKSFQVK
ncbi:MAG: hypothetical protein C0597_04780 [Marinilabiliales bacterium]|nr:MAG: hypothetical protein C0597_04780 [Marinilabiliales bacterium]